MRWWYLVVAMAAAGPTASVADIYVCPEGGDYPDIASAIAAASDGEVIELCCDYDFTGPNNRELDYGGKRITIRSACGDPDRCVIDCEGQGRGFRFHGGETSESILEGVTIRDGYVTDYGGAISC